MAKESGMGMTALNVDDSGGNICTIANDINSFTFSTPRGVQVTTGLDKSAEERLLLLADASLALTGTFNDAASMSHVVFSTTSSSSVARTTTISHSGQCISMELLYPDYQLTRPQGGELTWTSTGLLANGAVPTWAAA